MKNNFAVMGQLSGIARVINHYDCVATKITISSVEMLQTAASVPRYPLLELTSASIWPLDWFDAIYESDLAKYVFLRFSQKNLKQKIRLIDLFIVHEDNILRPPYISTTQMLGNFSRDPSWLAVAVSAVDVRDRVKIHYGGLDIDQSL